MVLTSMKKYKHLQKAKEYARESPYIGIKKSLCKCQFLCKYKVILDGRRTINRLHKSKTFRVMSY